MNKLSIFAIFFLLASIVHAQDPVANAKKLQFAFEQHFGPVQNISWSQTINELMRADFKLNGKSYAAYFDKDNCYVSTARVLMPQDLSVNFYELARNNLNNLSILCVVEFWNEDMHVYFVEGKTKLKTKVFMINADDIPQQLYATRK